MRILGDTRQSKSALHGTATAAFAAFLFTSATCLPDAAATDLTQTMTPKAAASANPPLDLDVQDITNQDSVDPGRNDRLFTGNRYKVEAKINPAFSVNSSLRFEPPPPALIGGEASGNPAVYLDQLFVQYEWESTAGLRLGKFDNPRFGVAAPGGREVGIFGRDSPLDAYETGRALGVNPYVNLGGNAWTGRSRVDASVFRFDESPFSGSWTDYREPEPGQAATGAPEPPPSVAFALNGSDPFKLKGLGYHLGYQQVARGTADSDRQYGLAAGLSYGTVLGGTRLGTAAEIGYMRHQDGLHGDDLQPGMALQGTLDDTWRAFANYSAARRSVGDSDAGELVEERNYGAGVGYSFDSGPNLDLAWNRKTERPASQEQPGAPQDSVGVRVHYGLKF